MAARPITESGIEILHARVVWRDLLVALVHQERAIEWRRFDGGSYWRRLGHPLRQGVIAEPLRKVVHRWPEDQRLNRWHGDRGWRRSLRRGWPSELKASCGLAVFEHLCRQGSADRERIQPRHAGGCAEVQNLLPQSRRDWELRHVAY